MGSSPTRDILIYGGKGEMLCWQVLMSDGWVNCPDVKHAVMLHVVYGKQVRLGCCGGGL